MHVFGNVWGYDTFDENNRHYSAFTKEDCRCLQVLQNKVARLKTGLDYDTPTENLLAKSNELSVHQLIAYHTILSLYKTLENKKPAYIYNKLRLRENIRVQALRNNENINVRGDLTVTRGGFTYRAAKLYNMIPGDIRNIKHYKSFKKKVKKWIKNHISIRP